MSYDTVEEYEAAVNQFKDCTRRFLKMDTSQEITALWDRVDRLEGMLERIRETVNTAEGDMITSCGELYQEITSERELVDAFIYARNLVGKTDSALFSADSNSA